MALMLYESSGLYETNKKTVDKTDAEIRSDLLRVHVLCRGGLSARD
jgi:hypothetical protein